jgi:glutamyl-tRNA synthetase
MTATGITRLAPSPTGALHLGNARTFLINALQARQGGWRVLMRVEDLDGPRVKAGADRQMLEELTWLGLSWEGPVVCQSSRSAAYTEALEHLRRCGAVYPCTCTRRDAELAASAPHADDRTGVYPGTCRDRYASGEQAAATGKPVAWRVRTDDQPITVNDEFAGPRTFHLARDGGDFVVFKSSGQAAYQLAVVVDDEAAGVDCIVRGDDLLDSAARQMHLRRLLGMRRVLRYWHLPLVVGPDGRRLAKRHGDTRIARYRAAGVSPQRVLGLLGRWSGLLPQRQEATLEDLARRFDLSLLPHRPAVFGAEDQAYLLGGD